MHDILKNILSYLDNDDIAYKCILLNRNTLLSISNIIFIYPVELENSGNFATKLIYNQDQMLKKISGAEIIIDEYLADSEYKIIDWKLFNNELPLDRQRIILFDEVADEVCYRVFDLQLWNSEKIIKDCRSILEKWIPELNENGEIVIEISPKQEYKIPEK